MATEHGRRSQTSVPQIGVNPNHDILVRALTALTHGKCAFCEAKDSLTTHRFRPTGNALPLADRKDAHLFYVWLADAWQNLFPICMSCRQDEPYFPVEGARCKFPSLRQIDSYISRGDGIWASFPPDEVNLLLDPSRETAFERHLKPKLDGTLVALSPRASVTVEAFNLNREERRRQRATQYERKLDYLRELLGSTENLETGQMERTWDELFAFGRMEFGGTWLLLLKRLADRIDLPDGSRVKASRRQLKASFQRLATFSSGGHRLDLALSELLREDPSLRSVSPRSRRIHPVRAQLRTLEVSNFKVLEKIRLDLPALRKDEETGIQHAPALVILGENATGKSSLLEAVALTLTTEEARRSLEIEWDSIPLDPSQMGDESSVGKSSAQVQLQFDGGQNATIIITNSGAIARSEFGNERVAVFAYGAFRRFSDERTGPLSSKHIRNLFDATDLANPEPWLKSLSPQQFDMVVRTLRDLLSIEGDFDVIQRVGRSRQLRMVTTLTGSTGGPRYSRTPLKAVSSGYRSMLGMLCDILRGLLESNEDESFSNFETARGVVLIDEIEAHLHPRWKVQVMTSLRKALPGVTFIVTTHDPLCLRGMGRGEVVVLQRIASSDGGVESNYPVAVEQMTDLPDAADLRVEQLLTSDFFQLFSSSDAATDRRMAHIGDLIASRANGQAVSDDDARILREFEQDIASALPVGSSEVHRMVQEAVAEYLAKRREASSVTLARLSKEAKGRILAALETL